jgi:outer membrane protein assembly factor BamB
MFLSASRSDGALYGSARQTGKIFEIDPTTGNIARRFDAPDAGDNLGGLSGAEGGNVLIWRCSTGETTADRLTRIDAATGSILSFGDDNYIGNYARGLAWDRIDGTDYVLTASRDSTVFVYRASGGLLVANYGFQDSAGDAIPITSIGGDGFGRTFVALYDQSIREINPLTGAVLRTLPFTEPGAGRVHGLAYDGELLYGSFVTTGALSMIATFNPDSGEVIRSVRVNTDDFIFDLAVATPEPSASLLCLCAVVAMPRRRRSSQKRRQE